MTYGSPQLATWDKATSHARVIVPCHPPAWTVTRGSRSFVTNFLVPPKEKWFSDRKKLFVTNETNL